MNWSSAFADRVQRDVPLADRNWYRLGGAARYYFSPENVDELRAVIRESRDSGIPYRVLGAGANLLVRDAGFDGLVIRLDQGEFNRVVIEEEIVVAGAGVDLMQLSRDCSYAGLSGLECLAGIPGTVGGATVMNAGGRFGQFADVVTHVGLLETDGTLHRVAADAMGFGYRRSNVGDRVVTHVELRMQRGDATVSRDRFQEIWRYKKASQPLAAHSAGCVFRNPPGAIAGKLIDDAGLKGMRFGKARVSEVHGNFIVADTGATAGDVMHLVSQVQQAVLQRSGICLELEIAVW